MPVPVEQLAANLTFHRLVAALPSAGGATVLGNNATTVDGASTHAAGSASTATTATASAWAVDWRHGCRSRELRGRSRNLRGRSRGFWGRSRFFRRRSRFFRRRSRIHRNITALEAAASVGALACRNFTYIKKSGSQALDLCAAHTLDSTQASARAMIGCD